MVIVQSVRHFSHRSAAALALLVISFNAWAVLPTPVAPSTGPAAGNWLDLIKGYIKDGGLVLGLAISVIGFLWVAYIGISKFNDARRGKAEWAEVGLVGIVGGAILLFAVFLLNEAANVI
jgi:integrating conjugative element membrane protein (TIGR03745 family)